MPCYLCVLKSAWQCTWTEATQNNSVNSQICRSCTACTPGTLSMLRWRSDMEMCGGVACSSNIPCLDTWRATWGQVRADLTAGAKREHQPLTQEAWPVERMWQVIEPSPAKTSQDPGKAWGCSPQSHAGTLGWTPAGPRCWSEPEWPLQERTAAGRPASGGAPPCDGRICRPKDCLNCFDLNESNSKTWHVTGSAASLPLGFKPWVQRLCVPKHIMTITWTSIGEARTFYQNLQRNIPLRSARWRPRAGLRLHRCPAVELQLAGGTLPVVQAFGRRCLRGRRLPGYRGQGPCWGWGHQWRAGPGWHHTELVSAQIDLWPLLQKSNRKIKNKLS